MWRTGSRGSSKLNYRKSFFNFFQIKKKVDTKTDVLLKTKNWTTLVHTYDMQCICTVHTRTHTHTLSLSLSLCKLQCSPIQCMYSPSLFSQQCAQCVCPKTSGLWQQDPLLALWYLVLLMTWLHCCCIKGSSRLQTPFPLHSFPFTWNIYLFSMIMMIIILAVCQW